MPLPSIPSPIKKQQPKKTLFDEDEGDFSPV